MGITFFGIVTEWQCSHPRALSIEDYRGTRWWHNTLLKLVTAVRLKCSSTFRTSFLFQLAPITPYPDFL